MRRQALRRANANNKSDGQAETGSDRLPASPGADGSFPIRIARDGVWYYNGSPIRRTELAKLFSTVLRRDEHGRYWLETPAERGTIEVEDAPFTAVELTADGEGSAMMLHFRNNFGDWVTAGPEHPISVTVDPATGEPSPYVRIRDGLDALIVRSVFYQLVDLAATVRRDGRDALGVWSDGAFFELGEIA